jgi:hypothetical protein
MSDDLDIRSGGAIAVDTMRLRAGADGYAQVGARLADLHRTSWHEAVRLTAQPGLGRSAARAWAIAWRLQKAADDADTLADRLSHLAAVYEIVELEVARRASDGAEAERIEARLRELISADPAAATDAQRVEGDWQARGIATIAGQYAPLGLVLGLSGVPAVAGAARGAGLLIERAGAGTIPRDAVLAGAAQPVHIRRVAGGQSVAPPATLAEAASRFPRGEARVRIEKYALPGGSSSFALYVAGTNTGGGKREAWDWSSNVELYSGRRSASFDATAAALRAAGAKPGDAIYEFGHSQGGMIVGRLALEGGYDARAVVTFGSPTEAQVDAGTLSVQLRHTDDPVAALAGGGAAARVGAPDSVVVERVAGSPIGTGDPLKAHHLDTYAQTAGMFDRSDDPRAGALRARLDELRGAGPAETFEFAVERVDPR